jgi:hypothetical protein
MYRPKRWPKRRCHGEERGWRSLDLQPVVYMPVTPSRHSGDWEEMGIGWAWDYIFILTFSPPGSSSVIVTGLLHPGLVTYEGSGLWGWCASIHHWVLWSLISILNHDIHIHRTCFVLTSWQASYLLLSLHWSTRKLLESLHTTCKLWETGGIATSHIAHMWVLP